MTDPLTRGGDHSSLTLEGVSDHVTDVDNRLSEIHRSVNTAGTAGLAIAVILVLAVLGIGYFVHANGRHIADVDAARIADQIQRDAEARNLRTAGCSLDGTLEDVYSAYSRDTWPGGPGDYDDAIKRLTDAGTALRCGR